MQQVHPILEDLKESTVFKWLYALLAAFNHGDYAAYDALQANVSKQVRRWVLQLTPVQRPTWEGRFPC